MRVCRVFSWRRGSLPKPPPSGLVWHQSIKDVEGVYPLSVDSDVMDLSWGMGWRWRTHKTRIWFSPYVFNAKSRHHLFRKRIFDLLWSWKSSEVTRDFSRTTPADSLRPHRGRSSWPGRKWTWVSQESLVEDMRRTVPSPRVGGWVYVSIVSGPLVELDRTGGVRRTTLVVSRLVHGRMDAKETSSLKITIKTVDFECTRSRAILNSERRTWV